MKPDAARAGALLRQLDLVEAELRAIGYWCETEPSDEYRRVFQGWLQFEFLPVARKRVAEGDLPANSQVGLMALREYDYHSSVPEALHLVALLNDFDAMVESP